jgi:hypothetical protein
MCASSRGCSSGPSSASCVVGCVCEFVAGSSVIGLPEALKAGCDCSTVFSSPIVTCSDTVGT